MSIDTAISLVDFEWSSDGDFVIRKGDLSDTYDSTGKGFVQECEDRIKSEQFDWKLLPTKGANLIDFFGENNTEKTRKTIEEIIKTSLTEDGFLDSSDVSVYAAPLSSTEIVVRVDIDTQGIEEIPDSEIIIKIVYDLQGQGPFILR